MRRCRGFASESYIYSAAQSIDAKIFAGGDRPCGVWAYIYYFGDYDPSGTRIDPAIECSIRRILTDEFGWLDVHAALLSFRRVAVTEEQIAGSLGARLPTRPTKILKNAHAKGWAEDRESVELDAIPAGQLRRLVRAVIEQHIDRRQLEHLRVMEAAEREQLTMFGKGLKE